MPAMCLVRLRVRSSAKKPSERDVMECVLLLAEQYDEFMERMIHMELYIEALERLAKDNGRSYSQEEVMQEFGITREQLDSCDVEIE